MKKNSKSSFQEFEKFFGSPPTTNQKAWGIIHDFYNLALTYMKKKEPKEITKADLARKLGKSRSAITQMFNKTPNISIKRIVEIADAIGFNIKLYSDDVKPLEREIVYVIIRNQDSDEWDERNYSDSVLLMPSKGELCQSTKTISYGRGYYGK